MFPLFRPSSGTEGVAGSSRLARRFIVSWRSSPNGWTGGILAGIDRGTASGRLAELAAGGSGACDAAGAAAADALPFGFGCLACAARSGRLNAGHDSCLFWCRLSFPGTVFVGHHLL